MTKYEQILIGDVVEYDDQLCVVESLKIRHGEPAFLHLRAEDGTQYTVLASTLAVAVASRRRNADVERVPTVPELPASIPEPARRVAVELAGHLLEVKHGRRHTAPSDAVANPRYDPSTTTLSERIAAKACELGRTERSMWAMWTRFEEQGAFGLIDRRTIRLTNPLHGADPRLVAAIVDQAQEETNDSTGTLNRFRRRVKRRLDDDHGEDAVVLPSAPTFNKFVRLLTVDRYTTGPSTTRRSTANQADRSFNPSVVTRPGQVVEFDTTPVDAFAFDPETGQSFAIELTYAIDVCTRSVLAWRMVPLGTKAVDAALLLVDMLVPEPMRPAWPDSVRYRALHVPYDRLVEIDHRLELAAARPLILPETILIDRGKVYLSRAFMDACHRSGIDVQPARPRTPTDKPHVERGFGTFRTSFEEHLAGYKAQSVAYRGQDPESDAHMTVAELEEYFAEFVVCIYQRRSQRGIVVPGWPDLELSPNDAYNIAVQRTGVIAIPPDPALYFEMLQTIWVKNGSGGVQVRGLKYRSPLLHDLRRCVPPYPTHPGKWPIKYDPRDRNFVFLQDPRDGKWHALPWAYRYDDTEPFTDRTLDYVKRMIVERGGSKKTDEAEIASMLWDLQNRTDTRPSDIPGERRRRIRDAERGRQSARDRARAGMSLAPLEDVIEDPQDDVFDPSDLDIFETAP